MRRDQVKKVICHGIFKVLYHRNLKWNVIKVEDISTLFTSVTNPTSWDGFFAEAVGFSIQQELVLRGQYCPKLEETLVEYESGDKTWADLEKFVIDNKVRCAAVV